eukprot:2054680-Prymnesium_polylepis.4
MIERGRLESRLRLVHKRKVCHGARHARQAAAIRPDGISHLEARNVAADGHDDAAHVHAERTSSSGASDPVLDVINVAGVDARGFHADEDHPRRRCGHGDRPLLDARGEGSEAERMRDIDRAHRGGKRGRREQRQNRRQRKRGRREQRQRHQHDFGVAERSSDEKSR